MNYLEGIFSNASGFGLIEEYHFSFATFFLSQLKTMARVDDLNWLSSEIDVKKPDLSTCSIEICKFVQFGYVKTVSFSVIGVDRAFNYAFSNSSST